MNSQKNIEKNIIHKRMKAIKSSGSKIELKLSKALWHKGHRYRKNDKSLIGKPDLVFKKYKIAIFVDSEFWHGKNWEVKKYAHKKNVEYWHNKIERNIQRDKYVTENLIKSGWLVIRIWGEDIEKNLLLCVSKIEKAIDERKKYIQNN